MSISKYSISIYILSKHLHAIGLTYYTLEIRNLYFSIVILLFSPKNIAAQIVVFVRFLMKANLDAYEIAQ
jgi:hypothetical protein